MSVPPLAETALERPPEGADMSSLVLQGVVDFLAQNPVFTGLLIVMLVFVFFSYLFVRRTLTGLREGYDRGRRGN
nr:hypothetical protein [Halogranum amylolyticum]